MKLLKLAAASLVALGVTASAALAEWPEKPITVVVSFAAGGNADIASRVAAEALSAELGVPVNVVNKPGGAHIPAVMSVKEAPADGYTVLQFAPPSFMVYCNRPADVAVNYRRYIKNRLRETFGFRGAPLKLVFRRQ